jgi:hypothetical protein
MNYLYAVVLGAIGTVLYLLAYRRWVEKDEE